MLHREFAFTLDIAAILGSDMATLAQFMPPQGRLLLAFLDDWPAGVGCLRGLAPETGELKRVYVRPAARCQGIGRALLERLLQEAREIGYRRLRLDSPRFAVNAHRFYRTMGFGEIDAYPGVEIPPKYHQHWIFMETSLAPGASRTAGGT